MSTLTIDPGTLADGRIAEGSFAQNEEITSLVIPEGVTDIGEVAFYGCTNLQEVSFPQSLRYIREEAFGESAIREAILPAGLELIGEKAFFSCEGLRKVEAPGEGTVIESDAFGCCDMLHEGYIAAGFPEGIRHHEELQYTLLWCSCPWRHRPETSEQAKRFIRRYEDLIMEWIIKYNNVPAMNGISGMDLLAGNVNEYIKQANEAGRSEITALLMSLRGHADEGEFEL